jgi:hypothetical protein
MEVVAHALWASSAVMTAKRCTKAHIPAGWTVWWAAFPDVLAFGPSFAAGLWLRVVGDPNSVAADGHVLPHVHVGLPLYPAGHSLIVFLLVFAFTLLLARRVVLGLFGWLMHIAIDIPTHSLNYYATRFLWPVSDYRVDGIAWWTPWLWAVTYGLLGAAFLLLWKSRPAANRPTIDQNIPEMRPDP